MILDMLFGGEKRHLGTPLTPGYLEGMGSGLFRGSPIASSGELVTVPTSLTAAPFWAGVRTLSGDTSQIPLITYRRRDDGGRDRAVDHPTFSLLTQNTGQCTSNIWLEAMVVQAICYGTAYSRIVRSGPSNYPDEIQQIPFDQVRLVRRGTVVAYEILGPDGEQIASVSKDDMFILTGLRFNCWPGVGLSVVQFARNTIGTWLAGQGYSDDFFKNGGAPAGWITMPVSKSQAARDNFLKSYENRHVGDGKGGKIGLLDSDQTWIPAGISPKDAMLIDGMEMNRKDIAIFLGVPPHKLGDDSKVSYSSLEQENQSYVQSGLGIWLKRIEMEANDKLFREDEKSTYYVEFLRDIWLQADTETRYTVYSIARASGILSANEIRIMENRNPYEGGDSYDNPNISVVSETNDTEPPADDEDEPDTARIKAAHHDLLLRQVTKAVNLLEIKCKKYSKDPQGFLGKLNGLEQDTRTSLTELVGPAAAVVANGSADPMTEYILSVAYETIQDHMLRASECKPVELSYRVADTQRPIAIIIAKLVNDLIHEDQKPWQTLNADSLETIQLN